MTPVRRILPSVLLAVSVGCSSTPAAERSPEPTASSPSPATSVGPPARGPFARIACDLPPRELMRVWAGYHRVRSGDIQFVPRFPNYVGNFASHSGPWPYLQDVPMLLYGPGHVAAAGEVRRPVTVADLAPTYGQLLGFDFAAPDGAPLREAVVPGAPPPRLIVTVVWDGGGRDVLAAYPKGWPNVRRLIPQGTWYEHATVGSSPSVTPAIHSSIGTGAWPRNHGIVDLRFRYEGAIDPSAFQRATQLLLPTFADEYDRALDNRPVVGMVGAEGTLGMIGRGTIIQGGDKDLAAGQRAGTWGLSSINAEIYDFPEYVLEIPGIEEAKRFSDQQDGTLDGLWLGDLPLDEPDNLTYTPGYARYQTGVIREIIHREGFGADDVPDLLYVNFKQIDKVGHRYSFPSPQMERVVASSDESFAALLEMLDEEVGEGRWVIVLTADHGSTPNPSTTGAIPINNFEMERDINAEFDDDGDDTPVVQSMRVTQAWLDVAELEENGFTVEDVARYLMGYTLADNTVPGQEVPAGGGQALFASAFPGPILQNLPCLRDVT